MATIFSQAAGKILLDGPAMRLDRPPAAQLAGICAVYQTISLVSERSVGESIFFSHEPRLCGIAIEWRAMKAQHKPEVRCVARQRI